MPIPSLLAEPSRPRASIVVSDVWVWDGSGEVVD